MIKHRIAHTEWETKLVGRGLVCPDDSGPERRHDQSEQSTFDFLKSVRRVEKVYGSVGRV